MKEQTYNKEQRKRPRPHELKRQKQSHLSHEGVLIRDYYICYKVLTGSYTAVDSCESAQEIWLRVQQMMKDYTQLYDFLKYNQKEVDELRAERLAKTQDPLALMAKSNNSFKYPVVQNAVQNLGVQNVGNQNGVIVVPGIVNQNGNGNIVAAWAEGNENRNNGNQIRCYNCKGLGYLARNCTVRPKRRDAAYLQTQLQIAQKEEAGLQLQAEEFNLMDVVADLDKIEEVTANCILMANLQQASTLSTQTNTAPVYDSDGSAKVKLHENCYNNEIFNMFTQDEQYTKLPEPIPKPHQVPQNDSNVISEVSSVEQDGGTVEQHSANVEETQTAKFVRDFQSLANEADESLARHKALELEIERLLRAVVSQDIMSIMQNNFVVDTSNLQTELERTKERFKNCIIKKENEYAKLWNDWYKKCEQCKYDKISYDKAYNDMQQKIKRMQAQLGDQKGKGKDTPYVSNTLDPLPQKLENENVELEFLNKLHDTIYENAKLRAQLFDKIPQKVDTTNDLSNLVTSNSVPITNESKVIDNDKVIAPGMFRINPFKNSREEKFVPNKPTKASVRTNPITISQPHVIIKKVVNSDSNGFCSTGVDITTKTRRPQPRRNTKNDRAPSASKGSRIKNKEVEVEDHPRNSLLSKNKKYMSSECNNIKLAIRNDKSKIVCAMCKQCLITANHDACVLNYVNGMNSRSKKEKENISNIANQMKHKARVWKPKNVRSNEILASPKPSKPRMCLRWLPTGKMFDIKGKLNASSESNGDNACTPNPQEPTIKQFLNSTMFLGTVRFGNDHVAIILGFGDLQWGNILITRVYFVEGLGHNLFLVGQFCDSDLEAAFRRNTCFVRNIKGVDLLKRNRTTNLYTINLYDMAFVSLICLTARATSTKSWLWHQRLSHLNFDTINDLARNDLVTDLPKFKYHKEHLCPSCEQGKSKRASHPPKPIPNSKQRLHLLHMDLCSPMRIASINGKRYVLVIVDNYSHYTWVIFLRSKDKAPEEIKTFLKKITVILQALVIIVRTDNSTEFKSQVLQEYFNSVGISHQASSVYTPQQNGVVERRNRTLNDCEDIGKLGVKGDIGFFIGYSANSCAYRVYNQRKKKIIETMNVTFDELSAMAFEQSSLKPGLQSMTSGQISSGLDPPYAPSIITTQRPTKGELDLLFEAMYDDYVGGQPLDALRTVPAAQAPQVLQTPTASTTTTWSALSHNNC
ncbi:retrovirus-related pol polyprotein from transposon TNT 1-94 [Tanacetum coccineum]